MSKTQRTPPGCKVPHVLSENDITNLDPENPLNYVGRRQKRLRSDDLDKTDEGSLKDELLSMLTNWKKDQDLILNKLCLDIAELKTQNANIQSTSADLEKAMYFMSQQYEDMKSKLMIMEKEKREDTEYIGILENKLDDIQKRLKFTVIEFRNLLPPPTKNIKQETQRELCDVVQKTCNAFNVHVNQSEIKNIYRVQTKTGASTIVTEFTSVLTKNRILDGVKEFNKTNHMSKLSSSTIGLPGPSTPIYITESLTNKDRKLFAMARNASKTYNYKYCWTSNGRIYLRKAEGGTRVEIRDEADLAKLKRD